MDQYYLHFHSHISQLHDWSDSDFIHEATANSYSKIGSRASPLCPAFVFNALPLALCWESWQDQQGEKVLSPSSSYVKVSSESTAESVENSDSCSGLSNDYSAITIGSPVAAIDAPSSGFAIAFKNSFIILISSFSFYST